MVTHLQEILHAFVAQQAPAGGPAGQPPGCSYVNVLPIVLMFAIIYFLLIRPQQKQQRQHQALLAGLKKGDQVVTQGGMIGRIYSVTDRIVTLEVSRDVRIRVLKGQVSGLFQEPGEENPAETAEKK